MSVDPLDGQGRVDALNVGQTPGAEFGTVVVTTAIWKRPVSGRRPARLLDVDDLDDSWKAWARRRVDRHHS